MAGSHRRQTVDLARSHRRQTVDLARSHRRQTVDLARSHRRQTVDAVVDAFHRLAAVATKTSRRHIAKCS